MATVPLCEILGRPMWLNLTIYFVAALVVVVSGLLYLIALKGPERQKKKRMNLMKTVLTVGIIIVSVMIAVSYALSEWAWLEKCDRMEMFVQSQVGYLKRSLNPDNIVTKITSSLKKGLLGTLSGGYLGG